MMYRWVATLVVLAMLAGHPAQAGAALDNREREIVAPTQSAIEKYRKAYACISCQFLGRQAATARAKIAGDDPLQLKISNLAPRIDASPAPYGGRYPRPDGLL